MSTTKELLIRAKETVKLMRSLTDERINAALSSMADALIENTDKILEKNEPLTK